MSGPERLAAAEALESPSAEVAVWAAVAAGFGLLLARPLLTGMDVRPALMAATFLALAAVSLAAPLDADRPRDAVPAVLALTVGVGAVVAATRLTGPAVPVPASGLAPLWNVGAAVAEEAFFRRLLYRRLVAWGTPAAILASAVTFAAVHVPVYGWAVFPVDLGAGLMFSWQRWASGRWTVPAATHAVANLVVMVP